jgi:hypothetical protein
MSSSSKNRLGQLYHVFKTKWQNEIAITRGVWVMNRIRRTHGLVALRVPSDYFNAVAAVLVPSMAKVRFNRGQNLPSLFVHVVHPLIPPCVACGTTEALVNNKMISKTTAVIWVVPLQDGESSHGQNRILVQGLALARASLQFMSKGCHGVDCPCYEDLRAVWLSRDKDSLLLPSFITRETSTLPLLDKLARYPQTALMVGSCDAESMEPFSLGLPWLCLSSAYSNSNMASIPGVTWLHTKKMNSRTVAWHVLNVLVNDTPMQSSVDVSSGLHRAVSVIETAIYFQPETKHLRDRSHSQKIPGLMLIAALFISVTFGLYVLVKDRVSPSLERELQRFLKTRISPSFGRWITTSHLEVDLVITTFHSWWNHNAAGSVMPSSTNVNGQLAISQSELTNPMDDPHLSSRFHPPGQAQEQQLRRRRGGGKKR